MKTLPGSSKPVTNARYDPSKKSYHHLPYPFQRPSSEKSISIQCLCPQFEVTGISCREDVHSFHGPNGGNSRKKMDEQLDLLFSRKYYVDGED
jgi:hypothetical protein